ncbi:MAG TPA: HAD-IC family P-type ATPase, partial [Gemmataceae bacterium]|nr:HAD-IC family P-type ATPase [Gemmataceae bacterium]
MRTLAEITKHVPADPASGLSASAVDVSRQHFGRNTLAPLPREPLWRKFLDKFDEPIIKILLAAALLSMIVDLFKADSLTGGIALGVLVVTLAAVYLVRQEHWAPTLMFVAAFAFFGVGAVQGHFLVEGLAVMIAVILATGVAFASEYKSDREFEVLNARKDLIQAKVLRDGQVRSLPIEDIVVGDIVLLETGDEIPADGRIVQVSELQVDQSLMTGESEPVAKDMQSNDDIYRGTQVVDGAARMLVTEVGDETALGQIARRLMAEDDETDDDTTRVKRKLTISKELTPLQQKLERLAGLISKIGYVAAIL